MTHAMKLRLHNFGLLTGAIAMLGCTSFSTVRSAVVTPASAFTAQVTVASPPGDAAEWFWSFDCESQCNHAIVGGDLAYAYGKGTTSRRPFTLGAGLNGTIPYVEGYLQLGTSRGRPFGIRVRAGFPVSGWMEHQLYGRLDFVTRSGVRYLWNPGVLYHTGRSPNGENPGTFVGLVQGFGVEVQADGYVFTPSAALVWGRTERTHGLDQIGPVSTVFGSAGISVGFAHRKDQRQHDRH